MTFGQLITEVQRGTGRNDSSFVSRIEKAINRAIREWARLLPWPTLETVDTITHLGGRYLYLPGNIDKVVWIIDVTNENNIVPGDKNWNSDYITSLAEDTVEQAVEWEDAGLSPTITTISGPLSAFSSDTSDIVGLYIQGQAAFNAAMAVSFPTGYNTARVVEELSIVGSTVVTTSNNFVDVEAIGKTDDTDGSIIIKAASGEMVAVIDPLEDAAAYRKIAFMNIPSAGTEFKYKGYLQPPKLISTNQTPPSSINTDFLIWRAISDIFWQVRENERAKGANQIAGRIAQQTIGKELMFGGAGARVEPEDLD